MRPCSAYDAILGLIRQARRLDRNRTTAAYRRLVFVFVLFPDVRILRQLRFGHTLNGAIASVRCVYLCRPFLVPIEDFCRLR